MLNRVRVFTTSVVILTALSLLAFAASDEAAAAIQLQLGDLLFGQGRYGDALKAYDRARQSEEAPSKHRAMSGTVKSALRVAEFSRAMDVARELKVASPRDAETMALYGDALWASGLFEEAERVFEETLELNPDLPDGHHGLARSLAAKGQLNRALAEAQTALRLLPREGEYYHTLASIYERQHLYEDAAVALGNYLNLLPNKDRTDTATLARTKIRFLRAFGRMVPFQMEDERPDAVHTVSFRMVKDKVMVRGVVNGRTQVEFVLDTGAEQTVLSRRTAERAGVPPIVQTLSAGVGEAGLRGLLLGRIDKLQIGTLTVENIPCLIKSPTLGGMPTKERDGLSPLALGLSMTIDYKRRELLIARHLPDEPAETELPLRVNRLAMVLGKVNRDQLVNFIVDTGGEVISISQATALGLIEPVHGRRIPLKVYGTSGWDRDAFLLPGIDLQFADIQFRNFPVVVLNMRAPSALLGFQVGGIVGHKFLSKYRVAIDLERSVVRLNKASQMGN